MKKKIFVFSLVIFLFFYFIYVIGIEDIVVTMQLLNFRVLVSVFLITVITGLLDCFKWNLLLRKIKKIKFLKLVPVFFSGEFFNAMTPGAKSGGEIVKAHYTSKLSGISQSRIYATIILDRSILMFVFFILLIFSVTYTMLFLKMPFAVTEIFRVIVGFFVVLSMVVIIIKKKIGKKKHESFYRLLNYIYHFRFLEFIRTRFETYKAFENFVLEIFNEFLESLKFLLEHKKGVAVNVLFSIIILFFGFFKVWLIFAGLGFSLGIIPLVIVLTLGGAVSYIMLTPGGAGVTEMVLISLYVAVGVDIHVAATVAIIDRAMCYLVNVLGGYVATIYLKMKY
ncbi:MAG: flippase-like domain-containing protein [archaeon]|nr:flippase-like domain-containing protein [archaeon]